MAWNRDSRPLTFLDVNVVGEAFLHHENRNVDKSGCISFKNRKYEVGLSLIGAQVAIADHRMAYETITVTYRDMKPFISKPLEIGEFCKKSPKVPEYLLPVEPETSRFLKGLEKKYKVNRSRQPLPSLLVPLKRRQTIMYEAFFEMKHTPFSRDIPSSELYESPYVNEVLGRL